MEETPRAHQDFNVDNLRKFTSYHLPGFRKEKVAKLQQVVCPNCLGQSWFNTGCSDIIINSTYPLSLERFNELHGHPTLYPFPFRNLTHDPSLSPKRRKQTRLHEEKSLYQSKKKKKKAGKMCYALHLIILSIIKL